MFFTTDVTHYTSREVGVIAKFDGSILGYVQDGAGGAGATLFRTTVIARNDGKLHHYKIRVSEPRPGSILIRFWQDGKLKSRLAIQSLHQYVDARYYPVYTCHRFSNGWNSRHSYLYAGNLAVYK